MGSFSQKQEPPHPCQRAQAPGLGLALQQTVHLVSLVSQKVLAVWLELLLLVAVEGYLVSRAAFWVC